MLMDFVATWGKWTWLILAGVFFVIELLTPGAFMLWLGLSSLLVGIIPLWRHFARRVEKPGDQPFLNRRAYAFVGREFTLEKPIVSGTGTVRIDDTIWRLSGPDVPGGSRVKVVRADAAMLVVELV
jgi:hypothetical protein